MIYICCFEVIVLPCLKLIANYKCSTYTHEKPDQIECILTL